MTRKIDWPEDDKIKALHAMTPEERLSPWPPADLDPLSKHEDYQLFRHQLRTFGYAEYLDEIAQLGPDHADPAHPPRDVLDRWEQSVTTLEEWHHKQNTARAASDRNPIGKVIEYERDRIKAVRTLLREHVFLGMTLTARRRTHPLGAERSPIHRPRPGKLADRWPWETERPR